LLFHCHKPVIQQVTQTGVMSKLARAQSFSDRLQEGNQLIGGLLGAKSGQQ